MPQLRLRQSRRIRFAEKDALSADLAEPDGCIRRGRERLWALEPEPLEEARRCLDQISSQWDDALSRLKQFVEE